MFALVISEGNMETITESGIFDVKPVSYVSLFLNREVEWVLIRGYVPDRGDIIDWGMIPMFVLEDFFDFDPDKIKYDWTNVVRKEEAP